MSDCAHSRHARASQCLHACRRRARRFPRPPLTLAVQITPKREREEVAANNREKTDESPVLAEVSYERDARQRSLPRIGSTVRTEPKPFNGESG